MNLPVLDKDFSVRPKFRHNLWTTFEENKDVTYLTVSHSKFEVPTDEAQRFLRIRSHCTGHHTVEQIAGKAGVPVTDARAIIDTLIEQDILHRPVRPFAALDRKELRDGLQAACRIWSEQLAETHLVNDIAAGRVPRTVLLGWLLETYHYVKQFPDALEAAAAAAAGPLREILGRYASQERGHEAFVAESLRRVGFTREEIETSIPLVSTRTIDLLMREMFGLFPASALLVAAVVEVDGGDADGLALFRRRVQERYGIPEDALVPVHQHVEVDDRLGHARLLAEHLDLVEFPDGDVLHRVVNGLHDLKHAFDLQKLEITEYYSRTGNYIPRQFVSFFAI